MEFFSNIDPLYRTYGKQEALEKQLEYFTNDIEIEKGWLSYCDRLKALSNYIKNVGLPWGDPTESKERFSLSRSAKETEYLHELWRNRRNKQKGYTETRHPFLFQGSADINTYKMFLELSLLLLANNGRMGLIVPSGIYTDKGSTDLRTEFLEFNQWEWLFGFENRDKIFNIHRSFKFCPVIIVKGGKTETIKATFMQHSLTHWENAEDYVLEYPRQQVEHFSPNSKAILEIKSQKDLEVLEKMYANGILLGDDSPESWGIQYAREFDMTNDSKLFPPRPQWEKQGYIADEYGHWLKGNWQNIAPSEAWEKSILNRPIGVILSADKSQFVNIDDVEDVALPLYEGRMIGQFDFSQKGWVSGKGRTAVWRDIPFDNKVIEPQYLMSLQDFVQSEAFRAIKLSFLAIGSSTNSRSMFTSAIYEVPCGNSVPVLQSMKKINESISLIGILNSLTYDFALRCRLGGININYFVIEETPLLNINKIVNNPIISQIALSLNFTSSIFSVSWLKITENLNKLKQKSWHQLWAITPYERLRLRCILDAVIASLYGLEIEDFHWILRDCDQPIQTMRDGQFYRTLDPKGFWRVDKDKDPELRHTVLSLVAFCELKRIGLEAFLALNNDAGWMIPHTLTLADYGLGHDERAKQPQPVAEKFALSSISENTSENNYNHLRFSPWQLESTIEESWQECERHAENLRRLLGETSPTFEETQSTKANSPIFPSDTDFQHPTDLFGNPLQVDLFGNVIDKKSPKKRKK